MLSPELRKLLMDAPHANDKSKNLLRFGGAASVFVAWRRHRAELLEACGPGRRPWAFWKLERRFRARPAGELGELRAIAQLNLYRDAREAEHVERRLRELGRARNAGRRMVAAVKRAGRPKPTPTPTPTLPIHPSSRALLTAA